MRIGLSLASALITVLFLFNSCEGQGADSGDIRLLEVNSSRVPCTGVAPMSCLQVRERGTDGDWTLFYDDIQWFEYEPGYLYVLKLRVEQLQPNEVPADGSSLRYHLISIEEKIPDPLLVLHDIWAVESIEGKPLDSVRPGRPYLELHISRREFMGNDGCLAIRGTIEELNNEVIRFSAPARELDPKDCKGGGPAPAYRDALSQVNRYERKGLTLQLFKDETELLRLKKVD